MEVEAPGAGGAANQSAPTTERGRLSEWWSPHWSTPPQFFRRPKGSSPWCRGRAVTGQMAWFPASEAAPISSGRTSVGGWRPLPGALGRRPGLEILLPVLISLAVVRPPDVRSGGPGRLQAGWVGEPSFRPLRLVQRSTEGRGGW